MSASVLVFRSRDPRENRTNLSQAPCKGRIIGSLVHVAVTNVTLVTTARCRGTATAAKVRATVLHARGEFMMQDFGARECLPRREPRSLRPHGSQPHLSPPAHQQQQQQQPRSVTNFIARAPPN